MTCWETCSSYFSWFLNPRSQGSQKWGYSGSFLFFCCGLETYSFLWNDQILSGHDCDLMSDVRQASYLFSMIGRWSVILSSASMSTLMSSTTKILTWGWDWSVSHNSTQNWAEIWRTITPCTHLTLSLYSLYWTTSQVTNLTVLE